MLREGEDIDYSDDLRIDDTALDVEWLEQPRRFAKYSCLSAKASRRVRVLEQKLKVLKSQLTLKAAQHPQMLGSGVKFTGPVVEAFYRENEEHQDLKRRLNRAQYEADIFSSAVFAFQQRKTALEELVRLHGQNYFAGPSVPRDLSAERVRQVEEEFSSRRVKKALNKKRRDRV